MIISNRLQELVDQNLISPSLSQILFGFDEDEVDLALEEGGYMPTAYHLCLFYTALVQAYYCKLAMEQGCKLNDLNIDSGAKGAIKDLWCGDSSFVLEGFKNGDGGVMFSLLKCFVRDNNVAGSGLLESVKTLETMYQRVYKNGNFKMLSAYKWEHLKSLIKAMPLLALTEYENDTFVFTFNSRKRPISRIPFLFFIDEKNAPCRPQEGARSYVLSSVRKGSRNYEIIFDTSQVNVDNSSEKEMRYDVGQGSELYIILQTLDINPVWHSANPETPNPAWNDGESDELTVDYDFLIRLTECTVEIVWDYLARENDYGDQDETEFWRQFKQIFSETNLAKHLPERKQLAHNPNGLKDVILELFLGNGVTSTVTALLYCRYSEHSVIFEKYLHTFTQKGYITKLQEEEYLKECEAEIESHKELLNLIVTQDSEGYVKRSREIEAEWRAFCILRAAGIKKEKIFPDVERILSIDDYYDKLCNEEIEIEDSLKDIFLFLNSFYGALIQNRVPFDEKRYSRDVRSISESLSSFSVTELIDKLIELSRSSQNNKTLYELTGRKNIIPNDKALPTFRDHLKSYLSNHPVEEAVARKQDTLGQIFVSYSHQNQEEVLQIVENIRKLNPHIDIFIDKDKFKGGTDWLKRAQQAMSSSDCKAILLFLSQDSVKSDAVGEEMKYYKDHFFSNSGSVKKIIAVNLERQLSEEYMKVLSDGALEVSYDSARLIYSLVPSTKIKINKYDKNGLHNQQTFVNEIVSSVLDAFDYYNLRNNVGGKPRIKDKNFSKIELKIANMYAFLKTGIYNTNQPKSELDKIFLRENHSYGSCIYPIVMSVKETRIKRDNVTMLGYEIITGKRSENTPIRYMLTSRKLDSDDYYCIPHAAWVGNDCTWMIEPLLLRDSLFLAQRDKK